MVIYTTISGPELRKYFDGCLHTRTDPGCQNWVVPGTWPEWCL